MISGLSPEEPRRVRQAVGAIAITHPDVLLTPASA
jgi:hypothetical protein